MIFSHHPQTALIPYLRGELGEPQRERVARHLEGCARCREAADSSATVMRELARETANLVEPEWTVYRAELRRKLAARERAPRRDPWWRPARAGSSLGWPSLAAAGVAVAALALVIAMRSGGVAPPPVAEMAMEDAMSGADLGLLRNYPVVEHLELLENYDVIEHLDEIAPPNGAPGNRVDPENRI